MQILVKRHTYTTESTIGDLFVDDKFICHTLEDCARIHPFAVDEEIMQTLK